jgi:hypothetical protein
MPDPQTVQAVTEFLEVLNNTDLPVILAIVLVALIVSPAVMTVFLARIIGKVVDANRKDEAERNSQFSSALGLAGQSAQNVELLRRGMEEAHTNTNHLVESFTTQVKQQVIDTRGAILESMGQIGTSLSNLTAQIARQGQEHQAQTTALNSLHQGMEAGFSETKAALGPILSELAHLSDGIAAVTASLSEMVNQPEQPRTGDR